MKKLVSALFQFSVVPFYTVCREVLLLEFRLPPRPWLERLVQREPTPLLALALALAVLCLPATLLLLIMRPAVSSRPISPPGWRLLRLFKWFFSAKTVNRVFLPTISDMQHEHIEALARGRPWKARWVLLRGYWSVWSTAFAQAPLSLLKRLVEVWMATS